MPLTQPTEINERRDEWMRRRANEQMYKWMCDVIWRVDASIDIVGRRHRCHRRRRRRSYYSFEHWYCFQSAIALCTTPWSGGCWGCLAIVPFYSSERSFMVHACDMRNDASSNSSATVSTIHISLCFSCAPCCTGTHTWIPHKTRCSTLGIYFFGGHITCSSSSSAQNTQERKVDTTNRNTCNFFSTCKQLE